MNTSRRKLTSALTASEYSINGITLPSIPVVHATTVLFDDPAAPAPVDDDLLRRSTEAIDRDFAYGALGTPTTEALALAVARIERGSHAIVTPSGQAAIHLLLSAMVGCNDHVIASDSVTFSTRALLERESARCGFEVSYVPAPAGLGLVNAIRPETKLALIESPGGYGFEIEDLAAICSVLKPRGITCALDNTWSGSTYLQAFQYEMDISVLSLTKSHAGGTGVSLGALVTKDSNLHMRLKKESACLGLNVSPDAAARLALGLTTLQLRLRCQEKGLEAFLGVVSHYRTDLAILQPSLPFSPHYQLWKRQYSGTNSLVTLCLRDRDRQAFHGALRTLRVFRFGHGWGGSCSLATTFDPSGWRCGPSPFGGKSFARFYIGLEDPSALAKDAERLMRALNFTGP